MKKILSFIAIISLGASMVSAKIPATKLIGKNSEKIYSNKQQRSTGTVVYFNLTKGFGFIRPDDGGQDIFVTYKSIDDNGAKSLTEGQSVEYTLVISVRGREAIHVISI